MRFVFWVFLFWVLDVIGNIVFLNEGEFKEIFEFLVLVMVVVIIFFKLVEGIIFCEVEVCSFFVVLVIDV